MFDPFDFDDVQIIQQPVKYRGGRYMLVEASDAAHSKYRSAQMRGAYLSVEAESKGEKYDIHTAEGMGDADSLLLSLCLYECDKDGKLRCLPGVKGDTDNPHPDFLVPQSELRHWPARVTKPLIEHIKKISGLDEEDTEEVLENRIQRDTKKLKSMRNGKAKDREKNSSHATTEGSA